MLTTCIGAYPKPHYLKLPDWFRDADGPDGADPTRDWAAAWRALGDGAEAVVRRAIKEVIADQVGCGIHIPTDGEVRRENYIHYHCRHLHGVDFNRLGRRQLRNGAYTARLPTITGRVRAGKPFLAAEWRAAQAFTRRPLKVTMPGPMTITDTTANEHYATPAAQGADLAAALNSEVRALSAAGCRQVQIDEPLFARKPEAALAYGIDHLAAAMHGCGPATTVTVHICCGYPDALDNPDYPKADPGAYLQLAEALDRSPVHAVSLEDAHRPNDLKLLESFRRATVILGTVAIAKSRVESVDEIEQRLRAALRHIDRRRLMAAPDCGLGLLPRGIILAKLKNLCEAARAIGGRA